MKQDHRSPGPVSLEVEVDAVDLGVAAKPIVFAVLVLTCTGAGPTC